uniref:Uncharacterized protein n=1 Tax=Anopheles atroparvus TaxID=41427 RepID=A0AAG5D3M2_ANOAO
MEQMEYASFVKELATAGLTSPRCPPETQYAREFEHRMEALLVNCEIADDIAYGKPSSQRSDQRMGLGTSVLGSYSTRSGMPKTSSMLEDNDEAESDGSFSGSGQEREYQRSSALDFKCSVDSGHGLSTRQESFCSTKDRQEGANMYHASASSLKKELSFEQCMEMSFQNEMQGMVEEICTNNPPLNASIFTSKPISGPTKRTYDEANS